MTINRNQILIVLGFLATQGPNLSAVAAWLAKSGIPHLTGVVNMLGWVATALGGLALAWPRIRSTLAAAGLATPPGALAPWDPTRDVPAGTTPSRTLVSVVTTPSSEAPTPRPGTGYPPGGGLLALVLIVGSLFLAAPALAQAPAPQLGFCVPAWNTGFQPAAALSPIQINLKTGDYKRVSLMAGWGGVYHGAVDLGAAVYVGVGISPDAPNAGQANLLFSLANVVAVGPGVQVFKDPGDGHLIWQGLLSLAINYNVGGSTNYLRAKVGEARASQGQ
jgi:hypothetical protein